MGKIKKDSLGDRMKIYEKVSKNYLMKRTPVIIRLDGKAFHTFTRGFDKPFDYNLINIMQQTMLKLCNEIQGCVLGYTQSDEITLVLVDYKNINTSAWFDNQIQKMASVSASLATLYFNQFLYDTIKELNIEADYKTMIGISDTVELDKKAQLLETKMWRATFDSRVFNIPQHEVINNLIWRQQDAIRNSISAAAQSLFSHRELQNVNVKQMKEKMLNEKRVNWENYSTTCKRGSCAIKNNEGKWFIDNEIPIFTEDREYVNKLIFLEN